jgi:dTDP-D-glucose 4,6-dehydratase
MKLNAQKKAIYGEGRSKRRIYLYFDQPCFVLPCVDDKASESNLFSPINEDNEEENISQERKEENCLTVLDKREGTKFPKRNLYCKFYKTRR